LEARAAVAAAEGAESTSEETHEETAPEDSHDNDEHDIDDSHNPGGVAGVLSNMFGFGGGGGGGDESGDNVEAVIPASPPAEITEAENEAKENHVTGGDGGGGYTWE
jgi:hypothetical protein